MRLLFVTPNLAGNSLGRTHCLWLLARALGHQTRVHAVKGAQVWAPLAGTEFAADCVSHDDGRAIFLTADPLPDPLVRQARWADLVVAVKPVITGFGVGLRLSAATGTPLLLDIDDPDHEVRTSALPRHEQVARFLLRPAYRDQLRLVGQIPGVPHAVSNPVLQARYGGVIIPHVRPSTPAQPDPATPPDHTPAPPDPATPPDHTPAPPDPATRPDHPDEVLVRFVGSARPHKGVDVLRQAVDALAPEGFRLEITASPPPDARPWERWLGITTMAQGERLVAGSDIVAIPSLADAWSAAQLPAKLIDAMMAGVAVVASDVGPLPWALGETGLRTPPGDVPALTAALRRLADPQLRQRLGEAARHRAVAMFGVEAVAPTYQRLLEYATERSS